MDRDAILKAILGDLADECDPADVEAIKVREAKMAEVKEAHRRTFANTIAEEYRRLGATVNVSDDGREVTVVMPGHVDAVNVTFSTDP